MMTVDDALLLDSALSGAHLALLASDVALAHNPTEDTLAPAQAVIAARIRVAQVATSAHPNRYEHALQVVRAMPASERRTAFQIAMSAVRVACAMDHAGHQVAGDALHDDTFAFMQHLTPERRARELRQARDAAIALCAACGGSAGLAYERLVTEVLAGRRPALSTIAVYRQELVFDCLRYVRTLDDAFEPALSQELARIQQERREEGDR